MASILAEIRLLKDGTEKDFLQKTFFDVKKLINEKNEHALEMVILRLDGLYPDMSKKAQQISIRIVNEIQEARGKK